METNFSLSYHVVSHVQGRLDIIPLPKDPSKYSLPHTLRNPTPEFPHFWYFNPRPFRKPPPPPQKKTPSSYKDGDEISNRHVRIRRLALFRNPSSIPTSPTRQHSKRLPPQNGPNPLDHHDRDPALPLPPPPTIPHPLHTLRYRPTILRHLDPHRRALGWLSQIQPDLGGRGMPSETMFAGIVWGLD